MGTGWRPKVACKYAKDKDSKSDMLLCIADDPYTPSCASCGFNPDEVKRRLKTGHYEEVETAKLKMPVKDAPYPETLRRLVFKPKTKAAATVDGD